MSLRSIATDKAPAAIGPYSQGAVCGGFLFTSMQIALHPALGEMVGSTATEQVAWRTSRSSWKPPAAR